jgi:hypothetical protein
MWKEVVMALFNILSQHLPGGTEENQEKLVMIPGLWTVSETGTS